MAVDIPRTAADDVSDALAALANVERELANLRAHLTAGPEHLYQAHRVAGIVQAEAGRVAAHVHAATLRGHAHPIAA